MDKQGYCHLEFAVWVRLARAAIAVLMLSWPITAAGEVAPLVPKITPSSSPEVIERFHDALAEGLEGTVGGALAANVVRKQLTSDLQSSGCAQGRCVAQFALQLGTPVCVTAEIAVVDKNYVYTLRAFRSGALLNKQSGQCDICTLVEAVESLKQAAGKLSGSLSDAVATPVPSPQPFASPQSAPSVSPAPNRHGPSVVQPQQSRIPPPRDFSPEEDRMRDIKRPWPYWPVWVGLGVGVAGLAAGIPLIITDGNFTRCDGGAPKDPLGSNCQDIYQTAAAGWVSTAIGITGLAASGVYWFLAARSTTTISISPTHGGSWTLSAAGQF